MERRTIVNRLSAERRQKDSIMTGPEVADFLRVHLSSVRRWSRSGKLRAYKVGNRGDWRYREQDVMTSSTAAPGSTRRKPTSRR